MLGGRQQFAEPLGPGREPPHAQLQRDHWQPADADSAYSTWVAISHEASRG